MGRVALRGVAGFVLDVERVLRFAGGRVLLELQVQQKDRLAFVGLGLGAEVGVVGFLGGRLERAEFFNGGVGRELKRDRNAGGRRSRIDVPAGVDLCGNAEESLAAGRSGIGLDV